ncbi:rnf12-a [Symbiodinium microadriaticum]|nr:rnf12-a [Symbiodinium microadriaticum]
MARSKRSASASPERGKKRRKVVLVKAQAAAEKAALKEKSRLAKSPRPKPSPIPGGTAGRILEWLGHSQRPDRFNTERVELQAPAQLAPKARSPEVSRLKPAPRADAAATDDSESSATESRSSSPSRSPSPIMAPAVVPPPPAPKVNKRPKAASPKKVKKTIAAVPPAAKAKKVATAEPSFPAKNKKASAEPMPAKSKKAVDVEPKPASVLVQPPAAPAAPQLSQPELSELDQLGLQEAVLERLRSLCDKDVEPKVLAEYIVVLAQMNKGPEHLSGELEAFFSDKASLHSFVRWVEDCKYSFLPGGQPAKHRNTPMPNGKGSQPADFWGPAPDTSNGSRLASKTAEASPVGPKTVRRGNYGTGPHVAVTSRVVLQPNPNFDAGPVKAPTSTSVSKVASKAQSTRSVQFTMPPVHTAEAQKVHLLGDLTKTLQTILTKLQDRELPDSQREQYQAMADKIHLRIKAINLPGAAPALISSLPLPLKHKSPTGPPGLYDTTRVPRLRLSDQASPFFFGSGAEAGVQDNLVEVVRRNPAAASRLLYTTALFSSAGNAVSAGSCFVFLWIHWQLCATCDRPLRWWLLLQACIQLVQMPVRMALLYCVCQVEESGTGLEDWVVQLTSSKAWRLSKNLAIFQYGWFVLGMVWWMHTDSCPDCPAVSTLTAAVMSLSAVRATLAIAIFRALFRDGDLSVQEPAAAGATREQISALPAFRFTKALCDDQDAPCSICLSGFADGTLLRRLPCGHEFHRQCIDRWLRRNKRCPLCMASIECGPLRHRALEH